MKKYKVETSYKIKDHSFDVINHVSAENRDAAIEKVKSHLTSMKVKELKIVHAVEE